MGCSKSFVRYMLFFTNLLFALWGLLVFHFGIAVKQKVKEIDDVAYFQFAPIGFIAVGAAVFLITFFGCCGAIKENRCMLITYASILFVLMIFSVTVAVLIYVKQDDVIHQLQIFINKLFVKRELFHEVEKVFTCCGPNGTYSYGPETSWPNTCCDTPPCSHFDLTYDGCENVILNYFMSHARTITAAFGIVASVQLVAALLAMWVAHRNYSKIQWRRKGGAAGAVRPGSHPFLGCHPSKKRVTPQTQL